MKLYNTESKKKEEIVPSSGKQIRIYTCGPTIYDYAHIGNYRTYVFEDLLIRSLRYFGYDVKHVMNLTDVDDKTIKGANEHNLKLNEYTDKYKKAFFEDLKELNIKPANFFPEATEYIPHMIKLISSLIEKGYAYKGDDNSIYFSISKFPSYGRLSHLKLDELKKGASKRSVHDEYDKENASDFVLWKSYNQKRDGNIFWESPFGRGRPGWHIECSAMAIELLGNTIDIHCGGIDNIFPHHENEIAQSEAYTGQCFVKHWAHSQHLIVDNKKMSKSLGNFFTLRDLLKKGYTGREVRYMLIQTHYRMQLNFTFEELQAVKNSLKRLKDFIVRLRNINDEKSSININGIIDKYKKRFDEGLLDDLNISVSLSSIFDLLREVNIYCDEEKLSKDDAEMVLKLLKDLDGVLQILPFEKEEIPEDILKALEKRNEARNEKNFKKADELRDYITSKGFVIEDTKEGSIVKRK